MHNVQIAIQDAAYAEELRRLLVSDGNHRVQVVDRPSPALTGVVVVDETLLRHSKWREEPNITRYLVLANEPCDADELWEIGIRRVVPPITIPQFFESWSWRLRCDLRRICRTGALFLKRRRLLTYQALPPRLRVV